MAEPITCAKCRRPFNRTFKACPFCNTPVGDAPALPATPAAPLTCRQCSKPFNPTFVKCPFCGAPAAAQAAATRLDYPVIADQAIAVNRVFLALDYHPASLLAMDAFFDITWGETGVAPENDEWQPNAAQVQAIIGFGAVVGEVIRRAFGGQWEDDAEYPDQPVRARVALRNGMRVLPINRAFKRMKNGASDDFAALYRGVREYVGAELRPPGTDGWLRQAQFFEGINRPDIATRFYEVAIATASNAEKLTIFPRLSAAAIAARKLLEND
jgi:hypothetical protein